MALTPVKSSNIAAIDYEPDHRVLTVQFKGGSTHRYADVSPEKHRAMMAAASIGSHFHKHIRNLHKSTKVDEGKSK